MKHLTGITLSAALMAGGLCLATSLAAATHPIGHLSVTSSDLAHGYPEAFTAHAFGCTGGNRSPALHWTGAPPGTKSFVLTLYDPDDHDNPAGWWHWVVYDIPAGTTDLPAGAGAEQGHSLPAGAKHGRTDLGNLAYHGPCPDKGDKAHRYTFTVYALDVDKLAVDDGASGAMVTETVHEHVLAQGKLVVLHAR